MAGRERGTDLRVDEYIKRALPLIADADKRGLAEKWVRHFIEEWLVPFFDRVDAPVCRRILRSGVEQASVDRRPLEFMTGHLTRVVQSEELVHPLEGDIKYDALRAAIAVESAAKAAQAEDIHLGSVMRYLSLALHRCVPLVRIGGRVAYAQHSDSVYGWVLRRTMDVAEAEMRLMHCVDIVGCLPHRTHDQGFVPVDLDSVLRRV